MESLIKRRRKKENVQLHLLTKNLDNKLSTKCEYSAWKQMREERTDWLRRNELHKILCLHICHEFNYVFGHWKIGTERMIRSSRLRLRLQELIVEKHHHHKSLLRQLNLVELLSVWQIARLIAAASVGSAQVETGVAGICCELCRHSLIKWETNDLIESEITGKKLVAKENLEIQLRFQFSVERVYNKLKPSN